MSQEEMSPLKVLLLVAIVCASALVTPAQQTFASDATDSPQTSTQRKTEAPASLVFWNRTIITFRSSYDEVSSAERATRAEQRIANLSEVSNEWNIVANEASNGNKSGAIVTVNGRFVFVILKEDLDAESGETLRNAMDQATVQLRAGLEARQQQRKWSVLLKGLGLAIVGTLLLLALWFLIRGGSRVLAQIDAAHATARPLNLVGFDLRPLLHVLKRTGVKLTIWAAAIVSSYIWLTFVLQRFPYTQPWGKQLFGFLFNLFASLGTGLMNSIPGMFTVVVIFLLARIVVRLVSGLFRA